MEQLKRMAVFAKVVELQSFTKAAQALAMTPSAVSQHVSNLEQALEVVLLNRSTRKLSLTEAGTAYYEGCMRMLREAEAAEERLAELRDELTGTLRIATTIEMAAQHLVPALDAFCSQYPQLGLHLRADDQIIDLIEQQIDLAIRFGWLADSSLVARRLAVIPQVVCAAPAYLAKNGTPRHPAELVRHDWLALTLLSEPLLLRCTQPSGEPLSVPLRGRYTTNSILTLKAWVVAGYGVARVAYPTVAEELRRGELVRLIPDHHLEGIGVYAVTQRRSQQPLKVQRCIEHLAGYFKQMEDEARAMLDA